MESGRLFSETEIQTWTARMTVWRDDHYSIPTDRQQSPTPKRARDNILAQ